MKTLMQRLGGLAVLRPFLAPGAIPISGRPVPSMAIFDQIMTNYMTTNSIEAGVLGIMRNERIVYLRGFGYLDTPADNTNLTTAIPLPENAIFRQASLSKYPTAATVRKLAEAGAFGPPGIDRAAFDLTVNSVNNNGYLNVTPWQSLGDNDWAQVKIRNLLDQTSGYQGSEPHRQIAIDLGIAKPPPTRADVIRWV